MQNTFDITRYFKYRKYRKYRKSENKIFRKYEIVEIAK